MKRFLIAASLLLLSACRGDMPADDAASAWKTYANEAGTFQISYPLGWTLNEDAVLAEGGARGVSLSEWNRWGVTIFDMGEKTDGDWLLKHTDYKLDPAETIMVDGMPATMYVLSNRDDMEIGYPVEVVVTKGKSTFLLNGFYRKSEDKDAFLPVFKKVVATFRHLQGASSSDTAE